MKNKLIFYIVFMIFGLSLIISCVVLYYARLETTNALNYYKTDALNHIKDYISSLDQNLNSIENEIVSQYSSKLSVVAAELKSYKTPENITSEQLISIAEKFNIEEISLVNKSGVVFQSTNCYDLNLNLLSTNNLTKELLTANYSKGTNFTYRALMSKDDGFNKLLYCSPKNSDYIIAISINLREYIQKKHKDSYLYYLINNELKDYTLGNGFLTEIEIYDVTNNENCSILHNNIKFDRDESFINSIDANSGLTLKENSRTKFYYLINGVAQPKTLLGKNLLIEATFDFSNLQNYSKNILVFSLVSLLFIGVVIFLLDSRFINTQYIKRIIKINQHLNMLEQGIYPDNLLFTENDEISEIAANMNKMKEKIMDRELQLRNKYIELEKATLALKESEERAEYDKLKNEFFANISHEFKTPLNILLGSLQLIDLYVRNGTISDDSNKLNQYMKGMRQNCYRLLRLINNLIDITKIDTSFFHFEAHNYDIVALVEGIVLSTGEYATFKHLTLNFEKCIDSRIIACDPDIIERIILNLLSNAIKFTPEGGRIDVSIYEKNNSIFISIKDNGVGIPQDKQQLIFERFRQVDKSFTRNAEGSGIGLSLVKALVEMHQGSITLESEYDKGSEFTVMLPLIVLSEEVESIEPALTYDSRIEKLKVEFSDIYS